MPFEPAQPNQDQASEAMTWELAICKAFNMLGRRHLWGRFFGIVSRLGDGVFWYLTMLLFPILNGWSGLAFSARLAVTGLIGTLVYKLVKDNIQRPRPCEADASLHRPVAPLDRWSFPSGHTLHAVSFTIMIVALYPIAGFILIPFAILVSISRLVLGLHYPTDVGWGAVIGGTLGVVSHYLATMALW